MSRGNLRHFTVAVIGLSLFAVLIFVGWSNRGVLHGLAIYHGVTPNPQSEAGLRSLLQPGYRWYGGEVRQASGGNPGILLVPGCLATQPFHQNWARYLANAGYHVLLLDSFTPRGIESIARLESICEGNELWGFQRAADVLVALQDLRKHPSTDPKALYLIGWSHGGWAVLDAVALAGNRLSPPHLESLPPDPLQGLQHTFAFYPYCGLGSYTRRLPWPAQYPALLFLARHDDNIDPGPCLELGDDQAWSITEFETGHWFDNPEGFDLVPHRYDAEATSLARAAITSLIDVSSVKRQPE